MIEEKWLEMNIDNIMRNLIQCEDHLRYLKRNYKPEHASCVIKHLYMVEGEAQEAISHSSVVDESKVEVFQKVFDKTVELRKKIQNREITPSEAIKRIREIRKLVGDLNPIYSEEHCMACKYFHSVLRLAENPVLFIGSYILVALIVLLIIYLLFF